MGMTSKPSQSPPSSRSGLSEELRRQFAALVLLDRVSTQDAAFHAALLEEDDAWLESIFRYMMEEDLAEVGENDHYRPTARGSRAHQQMLHQQQSYLLNFDIFAAVDLAEGAFGDTEQSTLEDPRWSDLRVAVAEYKGISAYRMVLLSQLADGSFFENPDWKYDLALGSSFFAQLEEIVHSQISVEELAYEDEDGQRVSGESVLEDVILQGAKESRRRLERERARQQTLFDGDDGNGGPPRDAPQEDGQFLTGPAAYDPWPAGAGYMGSALFAEAIWLSPWW